MIFGAGGVGQDLAKRLVAGNSKVFLADKDVSDVKLEGAEIKEIDALNSKEVSMCVKTMFCYGPTYTYIRTACAAANLRPGRRLLTAESEHRWLTFSKQWQMIKASLQVSQA